MKKLLLPLIACLLCNSLAHAAYDKVEFMNTVERNAPDMVRKILREGNFNANTLNYEEQTALYVALREPAPAVADVLIELSDTKLNQENKFGENALMMAAMRGLLPQAKRMVELGAEVNKKGWAPLHYAASSGDVAMIQFLIDKYAYIDAESPTGETPLMMAAWRGTPAAVQALLDAEADASLKNKAGKTAIDLALERGNTKNAALIRNWLAKEGQGGATPTSANEKAAVKAEKPPTPRPITNSIDDVLGSSSGGSNISTSSGGTVFSGSGTGRP